MCAVLFSDHKVIYLHSASSSAIWFHFSAAVITLDRTLEHKMWWVPYEKLPLNWESSGSLKAGVTARAFYQPARKVNLLYFSLTKAMSRHPKCFITLPRLVGLELFPVSPLSVGCASELTITTDKNTECNQDMCHGCLLFRDEMADWKTPWQWSLWCFSCMVICYEGRVSIYYRFGECWHRSRDFDVGRCQRFRFTIIQS